MGSSDIRSVTYDGAVAVTASDTVNDPAGPFAGFYVGAAGDVKVHTSRGQDVLFKACNAGVVYTVSIKRVWSTGTVGNGALVLGMQATNDVR